MFLQKFLAPELNCIVLDVKSLVKDCVGGAELQQCKSNIQSLSDQVNSALKKHVYENYMQFIETAKEISRKNCKFWVSPFFDVILFCRFGV